MKIAIDGGALAGSKNSQYGNYIFTWNLIRALSQYDQRNNYLIYTLAKLEKDDKLSDRIQAKVVKPKLGWLKAGITLREMANPSQVFLGLNQDMPFLFHRQKKIAFSHGLSFIKYPNLYPDSYTAMKNQLDNMVAGASVLIVSSLKVKQELLELYPDCKKIVVLLFGIPFDFDQTVKIVEKKSYFLFTGMSHPIKNLKTLIKIFNKFNHNGKYRLLLVGDHPSELNGGKVEVIKNISREELRQLYQQATAYLCTSFYESFNFPVLEALSQNCQVIALKSAVIPEMEKFVLIAKDEKDFLLHLKNISLGTNEPKPIETKTIESKAIKFKAIEFKDELQKTFSWKNYVTQLTSLYLPEGKAG